MLNRSSKAAVTTRPTSESLAARLIARKVQNKRKEPNADGEERHYTRG